MYWLFAGDSWDCVGGMAEFIGVFDTLEQAKQESESHLKDKWNQSPSGYIVKVENNKPVRRWLCYPNRPLNPNDILEWEDNGAY